MRRDEAELEQINLLPSTSALQRRAAALREKIAKEKFKTYKFELIRLGDLARAGVSP